MMLRALLFLCVGALAASPASLLHTNPMMLDLMSGQSESVEIRVMNVLDLYAWQFDLAFNPDLVQADEPEEGDFLSLRGPTLFFPGFVDNSSGLISFVANTLIGSDPFALPALEEGASGSGVLATVRFTAVASGQSSVSVMNPLLLDPVGDEPGAIPEPSTWSLLLGGAAVFAWSRLRGAAKRPRATGRCPLD